MSAFLLQAIKKFVPLSLFGAEERHQTSLYRAAIKGYLEILSRTELYDKRDTKTLQSARLKKVLRAARRTPYWGTLFLNADIDLAAASLFDEIKKIPPRKKDNLASVPPENLLTSPRGQSLLWRRTTGVLGMPISWAHDPRTHFIESAAYYLRSLEHFSFPAQENLARKFFLMFNYPQANDYYLAFFAQRISLPYKTGDDYPPEEDRRRVYRAIEATPPLVLYGAPSALWHLAQIAEADGAMLRPQIIAFSGEMMSTDLRAYLKKIFGCKVYGLYGTRELGTIGFTCRDGKNILHLNSENIILEVLDDTGSPCTAGEYGNLTMTSLTNLVMPLIRYQPGDIGRLVEEKCLCATNLPRFELQGRESEFLILLNGKKLPIWPVYDAIFGGGRFYKIRQYQIEQKTERLLIIRIIKKIGWQADDSEQLIKAVKKEISMDVDLRFIEAIEQVGRKFRTFIPLKNKMSS
ncbi:phenylacetate--CoA ligase family protein [Candidatus Wolfebacteria bacterium]|nr:phenylacetate--CoA ligase family protein [Candidatus Wolfebacteria bacterium]